MNYLEAYFTAAKATKSYWREFDQNGNHLILATFLWGPKEQTRHILFLMNPKTKLPTRSFSYEPEAKGDGIFLGEATHEGVRLNHGKFPAMTRDEFLSIAMEKMAGGGSGNAQPAAIAAMLRELTKVPNSQATHPTAASSITAPGTSNVSTPTSSDPKSDALPECDALLELAVPQLYRRNLFRVLNLPVTATTADVQRQQRRLEMERKLGRTPTNDGRNDLSLVPPPSDDEIRAALDRLKDPESRLLDEILWFWPNCENAMDDAAICAIQAGDISQAKNMWTRQLTEAGSEQIAKHNLAILDHLTALDAELAPDSRNGNDKHNAQTGQLWSQALSRWREVTEGEDFWDRARERVRQLNDIKLTTGVVRRIRSTMPKALLQINATLASKAAEAGNLPLAKKHLQVIREAKYGNGVAELVLRESLKPVRQRLKVLCDAVGPNADADPGHADMVVLNLLNNAKPLVEIVDVVLAQDDPVRQGLHDDVASIALSSQITYGNKTENWQRSLELLEAILKVSVGRAIRERIESNLEIVRKNQALAETSKKCWFCQKHDANEKCAHAVEMCGNVTREGRTIRWKTTTIKIPKCSLCRAEDKRIARYEGAGKVVGALIVALIGIGFCSLGAWALASPKDNAPHPFEWKYVGGGVGLFLFSCLWFVPVLIMQGAADAGGNVGRSFGQRRCRKIVKRLPEEFSTIKALIGEGWEIGNKPSANAGT